MELFSDDQSQLSLMDCVYFSDALSYIPFNVQGKPEELSNEFCFPSCNYPKESIPRSSASSLTEIFSSSNPKSEDSHSKRRKQGNLNCQTAVQSKNKSKRTRKSGSEKKVMDEKPPTDYIHVRARRGQATDSHSLAERVRRERISERMKTLQNLVPGCEKITGKALILDEIINYVESLKNQVEFLSMKLTSVNRSLHEFGLNFDDFTSTTEHLDNNPQLLSSMIQSSHMQSQGDNITVTASSSSSVLHGQGPTAFPQDAESYLMQVGDLTEALDHQFDLYSMCSFQQN